MQEGKEGIHEYKDVRFVLYEYDNGWEFILLPKTSSIAGRAPTYERALGLAHKLIDSSSHDL